MLEQKESGSKELLGTPSTKRTNDVLSPPNLTDNKKTKMADPSVMPEWAKKLPNKEDMQGMLDKFKLDVFDPFKDQLLGRIEKIEKDFSEVNNR